LVLEMHTMLQRSELLNSFAYLMTTMVGGFACFYVGFIITRSLLQLPSA
jgi:fluoride ion exporter CrcB/FEX